MDKEEIKDFIEAATSNRGLYSIYEVEELLSYLDDVLPDGDLNGEEILVALE